jgi:tRNA pseudouridine38-40 synthase
MRFKLTIEYAGTRYSGWQIQKNARTIQGEIDRALREELGAREFELYGSGRTDAGVHALAQVAHLDIDTSLTPDLIRRRLNDALPSDITILDVANVRHRFHARHDAVARSYLYQISRRKASFAKPFVWWVKEPLSLAAMREAAQAFVGFHDFRSFSDDDPREKSTEVAVDVLDLHEDGDLIVVHIEGSHFICRHP